MVISIGLADRHCPFPLWTLFAKYIRKLISVESVGDASRMFSLCDFIARLLARMPRIFTYDRSVARYFEHMTLSLELLLLRVTVNG